MIDHFELLKTIKGVFGSESVYDAGYVYDFLATPVEDHEGYLPVAIYNDENGSYFFPGVEEWVASEKITENAVKRYGIEYNDYLKYHKKIDSLKRVDVLLSMSKVACFMAVCQIEEGLKNVVLTKGSKDPVINKSQKVEVDFEALKDEILDNSWCASVSEKEGEQVVQTLLNDGKQTLSFVLAKENDGVYFRSAINYDKVKNSAILKKAKYYFGVYENNELNVMEVRVQKSTISHTLNAFLSYLIFASNIDLY